MHGPLDSIYNAEYQRVGEVCSGQPEACWVENLDTTAVQLAPYWLDADGEAPAGWLAARLRARGPWPYAALVARGADGGEVTVLDDLGDWGYGLTMPVREMGDARFQPWLLADLGGWLSLEGGPGFGIVDGPYGLTGRLWYFQAVDVMGPGGESITVPAGVYMVLGVEDGRVRFRPEIPQDMPCDPDADSLPASEPEVYSAPIQGLLDEEGRPRVDVAYGRGC